MKRLSVLLLVVFAFVAFPQKSTLTGFELLGAPAPEDSTDQLVYMPAVPACTVIYYPVIRENIRMGKGDKIRLIFKINPKDSTSYTELWQWDYKLKNVKNGDTVTALIKANLVP